MNLISKVLAQNFNFNSLTIDRTLGSNATWQQILTRVTTYVFVLAGVIAFFYLIISGFTYLTAGGNADNAKKGQTGMINAILGIVIIFLAYAIVRAVVSFLNTAA